MTICNVSEPAGVMIATATIFDNHPDHFLVQCCVPEASAKGIVF